jgi:trehalose-phosphatase
MNAHSSLAGVPPDLWAEAARARHRLLMLDYDGTLAPLRADRARAVPLPRSAGLLAEVAARPRTGVAVLSGRPIAQLRRLLGPLAVALVGEHGWELQRPGGRLVQGPLPPGCEAALAAAARAAAARGWGRLLDRKRSGLVLHVRRLAPGRARKAVEECLALWRPLAAGGGLRLERIDGGVELRARGRDKGSAALALIAAEPRGVVPVVIGDDATDEDAFDVVRHLGFALRVGATSRPSTATGRLPAPGAVADFLAEWLRVVEGIGPSAGV